MNQINGGHDAILKQLRILYVEDDEAARQQLSRFLTPRAEYLWCAADGREGLELFQSHHPDLVISDVMMPEMNGLQLAEAIKFFCPGVPVILTTAFNEPDYLLQGINLGVDAYLCKPLNLEQVTQTLVKSGRQVLRNRELVESRLLLQEYHRTAEEERHLVAELMAAMMRPERLADPMVRFSLEPTDLVSGDMITLHRTRDGHLYLMLADATGHGLPAALNLLPINYIFYRLSEQGLPIALMVEEMNRAVHELSPPDRFVAALVASIDQRNQVIEVWNGGIPTALMLNSAAEIIHQFPSANLPLGVVGHQQLTAITEIYQWPEPGQLIIWSDGITDTENEAGEALGRERLAALLQAAPPEQRLTAALTGIQEFAGRRRPFDDHALILAECR